MNDNRDDSAINNTTSVNNNKSVLCVGMCVLDIVHVCSAYPEEDSDKGLLAAVEAKQIVLFRVIAKTSTCTYLVDDMLNDMLKVKGKRSKHGRWQRGGNASNNCTVLTQLGIKCEYLGSVSSSRMFQCVLDDMTDRGIDYKHCVYYDCEAPLSSIILNESTGSRTIIHSNPYMPILTYDDFRKINLNDYGWINFEARNPDETSKMMQMVVDWNNEHDRSDHIVISLDMEIIQLDTVSLINFADVVFVSKDLAVHLGYENKNEAVHKLRELTQKRNIIICPWGTDGATALDSNDNIFTCKAFPPEIVVDSLGAGDTFAAAVIFALYRSHSISFAIQFASQLSGAKVGFFGYDQIGECFQNFL